MMKVEDIKTFSDARRYIEGCINDYEAGISTKEETIKFIGDYTIYIVKKTLEIYETRNPKESNP
jgi:hypothetical protein